MPIIESATNTWNDAKATEITKELDQKFTQKSVTGFLNDNNFGTKFAAAKTVIIRNAEVGGLVTYDRDNGFNRGPVTLNKTTYEVEMDRARSLEIDRIDAAETGLDNLAARMLNVLITEHAVPEKDAYTLSKLAKIALSTADGKTAQTVDWNAEKPYASLLGAFHKVHGAVGYDEELVAFVSSDVMAALELSPEVSRTITPSDFKQGGTNFKVMSINGVALLPVSPDRMYTAFKYDNEDGGFAPDTDNGAKAINFIVLPKKAAMGVQKTEKVRIFSPDVNQKADAYKVDYRVMYDVFVKKSRVNSIYVSTK